MNKKTIIIVGAGTGVSLNVAKKFGSEGFRVILIARREEALTGYVKELQEFKVEAAGIVADASNEDSLRQAFDEIKSTYGNPEVLVYNAAAFSQGPPSSLTAEQLINDFKVNVVGALTSAQQVIPEMIDRKSGTILFTGGGLALYPAVPFASLSVGKAGLRNLAYSLGEELAQHGIFVGTVTIAGFVRPGTYFDPANIAEAYYKLYEQRTDREVIFSENRVH